MSHPRFAALLLASLVCVQQVSSQSAPAPPAPPAESTPQPAAEPASVEPKAAADVPDGPSRIAEAAAQAAGERLLDLAARYQRGDEPRGRPTSLHGRFYVGVRTEDGSLFKTSVERWYTATPDRMLTHRAEVVTGKASSVCWDAGTAWFHDDTSGEVVVYSDAPEIHSVDLDLLAEQRRLTALLLQSAVLDSLRPRLTDVADVGERVITDLDGASHTARLVRARAVDELFDPPAHAPPPGPDVPPRTIELVFAIDKDTGALWELNVSAVGRADVKPLRLRFDLHGETRNGLRVPGNIKVFHGDEVLESVNLGVEVDADGKLVFDVDEPIDAAVFARPAS